MGVDTLHVAGSSKVGVDAGVGGKYNESLTTTYLPLQKSSLMREAMQGRAGSLKQVGLKPSKACKVSGKGECR